MEEEEQRMEEEDEQRAEGERTERLNADLLDHLLTEQVGVAGHENKFKI